jgi:hypothetical protein
MATSMGKTLFRMTGTHPLKRRKDFGVTGKDDFAFGDLSKWLDSQAKPSMKTSCSIMRSENTSTRLSPATPRRLIAYSITRTHSNSNSVCFQDVTCRHYTDSQTTSLSGWLRTFRLLSSSSPTTTTTTTTTTAAATTTTDTVKVEQTKSRRRQRQGRLSINSPESSVPSYKEFVHRFTVVRLYRNF